MLVHMSAIGSLNNMHNLETKNHFQITLYIKVPEASFEVIQTLHHGQLVNVTL